MSLETFGHNEKAFVHTKLDKEHLPKQIYIVALSHTHPYTPNSVQILGNTVTICIWEWLWIRIHYVCTHTHMALSNKRHPILTIMPSIAIVINIIYCRVMSSGPYIINSIAAHVLEYQAENQQHCHCGIPRIEQSHHSLFFAFSLNPKKKCEKGKHLSINNDPDRKHVCTRSIKSIPKMKWIHSNCFRLIFFFFFWYCCIISQQAAASDFNRLFTNSIFSQRYYFI